MQDIYAKGKPMPICCDRLVKEAYLWTTNLLSVFK